MINWEWSSFEALSADDIFEVLKVRQAVFVVEQNCPYPDIDELDRAAWHLMAWQEGSAGRTLVAYLRVVFPGRKFAEPSIGRVLTAPAARGQGLGKLLIAQGIQHALAEYPAAAIRISAQKRLEKFYAEFGFETVSAPYDEDGIPHIEMLRNA